MTKTKSYDLRANLALVGDKLLAMTEFSSGLPYSRDKAVMDIYIAWYASQIDHLYRLNPPLSKEEASAIIDPIMLYCDTSKAYFTSKHLKA